LVGTSLAAAACAIAFDRSVTSQEGTWKPASGSIPAIAAVADGRRPAGSGTGICCANSVN